MPVQFDLCRRSIRLRNYDYSAVGGYFVTICTYQWECLFGEVMAGEMRVNNAGDCVKTVWDSLPIRYPGIEMDTFIVMPNHIHGIILINHPVGAIHELPLQKRRNMLLPMVIGYLKMNSAKRINQYRNNPGAPVWQRNYYERVIRNDRELHNIRQYIADNPLRWADDENHPGRM